MSHTLLILKIYTTFKDVQMILKRFYDISTGFRFSKNQCECSVHSYSCPSDHCDCRLIQRASLCTMDNGHVMRAIFKNIPNNWPTWADVMNELWYSFGYFQLKYQHTFCHCPSLVYGFPIKSTTISSID